MIIEINIFMDNIAFFLEFNRTHMNMDINILVKITALILSGMEK